MEISQQQTLTLQPKSLTRVLASVNVSRGVQEDAAASKEFASLSGMADLLSYSIVNVSSFRIATLR